MPAFCCFKPSGIGIALGRIPRFTIIDCEAVVREPVISALTLAQRHEGQ